MSDAKPLAGKTGVVFGVANKRSIAWAIAKAWAEAGATLIFNYQGERLKRNVEQFARCHAILPDAGEVDGHQRGHDGLASASSEE